MMRVIREEYIDSQIEERDYLNSLNHLLNSFNKKTHS